MLREQEEDSLGERQIEYTKLLTRYRLMQGDRQAYTTESKKLITKQQQEIDTLESEKYAVLENLKQASCLINEIKDERACEDLANMADNRDWVQNQIDEQLLVQQELDIKIKELERKILDLKLSGGRGKQNTELTFKLIKRVRILEGKLEHGNRRYNLTLQKNHELRAKIDHLRIERARYDLLYKKLDKTLTKLRRDNALLMESSTAAFNIREDSQARMTALKEKSQKDAVSHNAEMKELIRQIDHERKLSHFMHQKAAEREEDPQLVAWKARKAKEADEKKSANLELQEDFELAMKRMSHLTEEEEFDRILNCFIAREDENFALFSYVHELRYLEGDLIDKTAELEEELEKNSKEVEEMQTGNENTIENIENLDIKINNELDLKSKKLETSRTMLETLMKDVAELFNEVKADRSSLSSKLGATEEVTYFNFVEYLRLIEIRVIELLRVANYIALRDAEATQVLRACLMGNGPSGPFPFPVVIPPTLADDFTVGEEHEGLNNTSMPIKRELIKAVVMPTVRRKEHDAANREPIPVTTTQTGSNLPEAP